MPSACEHAEFSFAPRRIGTRITIPTFWEKTEAQRGKVSHQGHKAKRPQILVYVLRLTSPWKHALNHRTVRMQHIVIAHRSWLALRWGDYRNDENTQWSVCTTPLVIIMWLGFYRASLSPAVFWVHSLCSSVHGMHRYAESFAEKIRTKHSSFESSL